MTTTDVFYTIHTASTTLTAEFSTSAINELNNTTRGESATFALKFPGDSSGSTLTVESGTTYTVESGTTEVFSSTNIEENGTLNVEEGGTLNLTGGDNIQELQQYSDWAGGYAPFEAIDSTQKFDEQIPSTADVDSIVLGMEPAQSLQDRYLPGVWGLVDSGQDLRTQALTNEIFEIELFVLAEYSEYSSVTDLKNTLEI